jgi:small subunit ribosomal protein S4
LCRRENEKLFLKGDRCFSKKCAFERRSTPPGYDSRRPSRNKESDYGNQLRAKQKARRIYGVLEKQFRRYFHMAQRMKGLTGKNLLVLLESRLDNVVYRLGLANSRSQARQLVLHGHFDVNGHKTNVPSFLVKPGDEIVVRSGSQKNSFFKEHLEVVDATRIPSWLQLNLADSTARIVDNPSFDAIEATVDEQLIVEYYSR